MLKRTSRDNLKRAVFVLMPVFSLVVCANVYARDAAAGGKGLTFWRLIFNGGWVMAVIGLLSIVALTLIIDLFFRLRSSKMIPAGYLDGVKKTLKARDLKKAIQESELQGSFMSNVILSGLKKCGQDLKMVQEAMAEAGAKEAVGLQQRVNYLSTIGTTAPMLGLLGTVLGMIQAFNIIAYEAGLGKPTALAGGVAQALVTTAFGLIVAIPAMGFFFYFRNRLEKVVFEVEINAGDISLYLGRKNS
ncbi:MAG: MotA/TolQ/ExbB proton channel family protein [Candidatus Omnitrophica bacterium]|nr:MotA/TolQ/ExbB proton channel family protein [Candidatus Omnitrophota bacterium]